MILKIVYKLIKFLPVLNMSKLSKRWVSYQNINKLIVIQAIQSWKVSNKIIEPFTRSGEP